MRVEKAEVGHPSGWYSQPLFEVAGGPLVEHIQVGLKTCLNKEFTNNNVRLQKSNAQASFM